MDPAAVLGRLAGMNRTNAQTLTAVKVISATSAGALMALFGGYFLFF